LKRILIVAPNWLGDAVMALPAIADVHRAAPDATMTIAARPAIAPLYGLVPYVASVVSSDDEAAMRGGFDTALLLPNSFRSAFLAWRAGVPGRWGYRTDGRGVLLTRGVQRAPAGIHQVDYYQQLVHDLGFPNGPTEPRLALTPATAAAGAAALTGAGWDRRSPLVAFAPGAAYGGAKRWPPECFAGVAHGLADEGIGVVMVGGAADAETGRAIARAGAAALNLIGATDLPALAGVLAACRALITNDSGAMHLAAALGVPVTAIFGPTDERATGPRGAGAHAVVSAPVWCRPCLLRECPLDHACMHAVTPDAVLRAARRA
jgi:lipopolysaccharide heptosyltransferase II